MYIKMYVRETWKRWGNYKSVKREISWILFLLLLNPCARTLVVLDTFNGNLVLFLVRTFIFLYQLISALDPLQFIYALDNFYLSSLVSL